MNSAVPWRCVFVLLSLALGLTHPAPAAVQIEQLNSAALWHRVEFRITGVPSVSNRFDPDVIRLDASFVLPSSKTMSVPAFWFQDYQRNLSGDYEYLTSSGSPEWRLRFSPPEPGSYWLSLNIKTNGVSWGAPVVTNFNVPAGSVAPGAGYVQVAPSKQYFETTDGQALRLIGENVAWHSGRGTYDYDDYFASMSAAGENYARILMLPWAFGIETDTNTLTNYRQDPAWRLDYVLSLAEQRGIYLLFCLDFHGMFEVVPDYWGGNNFWPRNPYNQTNGGPCLNQNAFFTSSVARTIYQKRLRYLIARYGYSPNLLAWQLLSEIDNEYNYLVPADVAAWHGAVGAWMHTNDPCHHLVTTSLTGGSNRPEIWSLAAMDFTAYHSYAEPPPAARLNSVARSFRAQYGKPVLIDEFGTDWRGWNRTNDLYLRGFRQGLWGGALGGSVGTAMSWWWENIHAENDYAPYLGLTSILNRTGWGRGAWINIDFENSSDPPAVVGNPTPGGQPFNITLVPGGAWGLKPPGRLAVPGPEAAGYAGILLNSFVQGWWHPEFTSPFALSAWLTNNARLVMHINSVSESSALVVRVDGTERFRTNLPNVDGLNVINNEYNLDLPINLSPGKRLIEITNDAPGWTYLDWVRLEQVLPAAYTGNWLPSPQSIGLSGSREALVYVIAPGASWPGSANTPTPTLPLQQNQSVTLTNWPSGTFLAEWYDPVTAAALGTTTSVTTNGRLTLPLPQFREDLAGLIYPPARLTSLGISTNEGFQFRFDSETGGRYLIEQSGDLRNWSSFATITNVQGSAVISDPSAPTNPKAFFRAEHQ